MFQIVLIIRKVLFAFNILSLCYSKITCYDSGIVFWFSKGTRQSLFKYLLKGQKNTNRSLRHQMPFEMRIQNDNIVLRYIHMMLYRLHRFKEFCGNLLLTQESSSTFILFLFSLAFPFSLVSPHFDKLSIK